jgi:hypothetical protein
LLECRCPWEGVPFLTRKSDEPRSRMVHGESSVHLVFVPVASRPISIPRELCPESLCRGLVEIWGAVGAWARAIAAGRFVPAPDFTRIIPWPQHADHPRGIPPESSPRVSGAVSAKSGVPSERARERALPAGLYLRQISCASSYRMPMAATISRPELTPR